jgi:hypothetical protein
MIGYCFAANAVNNIRSFLVGWTKFDTASRDLANPPLLNVVLISDSHELPLHIL